MQNSDKIQRLIFLVILNIFVLVSIVVLSNLTRAQENQELHQKTLYEIANHTSSKQNAQITVGKGPKALAIYEINLDVHNVYVTNYLDNTVSVIDVNNNTKIGDDIEVGRGPSAVAIDESAGKVYVANYDDNTVSVIDVNNNTKIGDDIKVGRGPSAVAVDTANTHNVYVTNYLDNTVSVIDGNNDTKIGDDIKVGTEPAAISFDYNSNTIYVANYFDDTISVIDGNTNSKKIDDIKVGRGPSAIGFDYDSNKSRDKVYVANILDDTVSVIDGKTMTKIGNDIKVENNPVAIGDDFLTSTIYVANQGDDTVSVIDGNNDTKIGDDIKVGRGPSAIGFEYPSNIVYVANYDDGTVSVIDAIANKVVAKVMFNIEPLNAGHIECDKNKLIVPIAQEFYIWNGSQCTAKPNQGFDFVSWQENLNGNSTQLIKVSSPLSFLDPILNILSKPDKPEATVNITKFGSFTANFKALPPPIPPEYLATLFTVVVTAFIGSWLTPTVIGWRNAKKQGSKLDHYHNKLKELYNDCRLDRDDIQKLNNIRDNIADEYTRGKINKEQHDKLRDEISISYGKIFTKEMDSLNNLSENDKEKQLSAIKSDIEDMHVERKIDNEYYANFHKEISILYEEIFKKRIDSLNNIPESDKEKLLVKIKDDISDAYSREKINELHYTLLKEKLSNYEKNKI
jgi:YVTN family beta-propeller protein